MPVEAIAGPWDMTFNAQPLGITEAGITLEITYESDEIVGDNLGASVQDGVYRGGNCFLSFTIEEANKAGVLKAVGQWTGVGAPTVADLGKIGAMGQLHTAVSQELVMTPIAGSTAASIYQTITAESAMLSANFPINMLFATQTQRIPMRFRLHPFEDAGDGNLQNLPCPHP